MTGAVLSSNLALSWVFIEGTTLASAYLIYFYKNDAPNDGEDVVSKMKEMNISNSIKLLEEQGYEIENRHSEKGYYILEDYAKEKNLDVEFLSDKLHMHTAELDKKIAGKAISIPYFNEQNFQIGVRYRFSPTSTARFSWRTGSKQCLYGVQFLNEFSSYIILVEGESDCHCAWTNHINALGVPGAIISKKNMLNT